MILCVNCFGNKDKRAADSQRGGRGEHGTLLVLQKGDPGIIMRWVN